VTGRDPIDVSVVIPTRNRWPLLREALASALTQRDVGIEVIVVVDGSDDDTGDRLQAIGDERIRVLHHETRRGHGRARNTGVAVARGEWIAFLDDDDLWAPRKLRTQLDTAQRDGAAFAYGNAVVIDPERRALELEGSLPDPSGLLPRLLKENVIPAGSSNVVARSDLVRQLEGFDARLFQLNDWDFWIRLADAGRAAACTEVLVGVRRHQSNQYLVDDLDRLPSEFEYLRQKHAATAASYDVAIDRKQFAHWLASGHRVRGERRRAAWVYARAALACRSPGLAALSLRVALGEWATGSNPPSTPRAVPGTEWLATDRA
jgi:glycosyltransferase involved in cell wall biosynthesis